MLPKPVAAHDRERHVMDGRAKIFKENNIAQNSPSPAEVVVTEFRVRCMSEKLLDVTGKRYSTSPIDYA